MYSDDSEPWWHRLGTRGAPGPAFQISSSNALPPHLWGPGSSVDPWAVGGAQFWPWGGGPPFLSQGIPDMERLNCPSLKHKASSPEKLRLYIRWTFTGPGQGRCQVIYPDLFEEAFLHIWGTTGGVHEHDSVQRFWWYCHSTWEIKECWWGRGEWRRGKALLISCPVLCTNTHRQSYLERNLEKYVRWPWWW